MRVALGDVLRSGGGAGLLPRACATRQPPDLLASQLKRRRMEEPCHVSTQLKPGYTLRRQETAGAEGVDWRLTSRQAHSRTR
jgi:hypothetical protein